MTAREKLKLEHPECVNPEYAGGCKGCPHDYGYLPNECSQYDSCTKCWDQEIPEVSDDVMEAVVEDLKRGVEEGPCILDSGARHQFESGAVRDIREGKGRCDLLPLDVVAEYLSADVRSVDDILMNIYSFQKHGDERLLYTALSIFATAHNWDDHTMLLKIAKQFEEGAKKYGDSNWQKGIPVRCYIDSAVRHYLKFLRGDKDEPHDRAFGWNLLCAVWTCKHKPELNDYL